jgi:F420-non-reducing hydrogenase iron-sulfur subunit
MTGYQPKIVSFLCNWCSYAGADLAGNQHKDVPANVRIIRVMCSGRVDPQFVLKAFKEGADGVMVLGCHPGDCHYKEGNYKTLRRIRLFEKLLTQFGIDKDRFKLDWVSASEGEKFSKVTREMVDKVRQLGKFTDREDIIVNDTKKIVVDFQPKIVSFLCNWCSYAGADLAGNQHKDVPPNVKIVRVMCSGRVDPQFVLKAFKEGADGVMVLGCHPGDCHYKEGNYKTLRRIRLFEKLLTQFGIDRDRFKLDWVSASEGEKFSRVTREMVDKVKQLGPFMVL